MVLRALILLSLGWGLTLRCFSADTLTLPFNGGKNPYDIIIDGDPQLHDVLEREIRLQRKNNQQLKQFTKRNKIARFESRLLIERLQAEGYYDASVRFSLGDSTITYRIDSGKVYVIKDILLQLPAELSITPSVLDIELGEPLRAERILAAKKNLLAYVEREFCLFQINIRYEVIAETSSNSAHVTFTVEDSPSVRFGTITFSGLSSIDEDYLLERVAITKGDCFKRDRIDAARLRLVQTNLFASVTAQFGEPVDGEVPVTLHTSERHHRTLTAGGGFQTDEGFGISIGWEHRNLVRRAQRLKFDTYIAEMRQGFSADLTFPHFQRNDQNITFYSELAREDTDAFESTTADMGVEISRQLKHHLRAIAGTELSFSSIVENNTEDNFALLSLPLSLEYDRRNDPLDARRGWAAAGRVRPYWDAYETDTQFVKSTLAASAYCSFDDVLWQPTLALRTAMGVIDGAGRDDIPANERFYAGGGGSVRGYPFQSLGPLDGSTPLGGLSFTEFSFETRLRWGKHWGGVLFIDGGFAYEETSPQLGEDLRWGAGLGLRYYTSFAPLRVDIAGPLDRREGIDDNFQLYISIGQSF